MSFVGWTVEFNRSLNSYGVFYYGNFQADFKTYAEAKKYVTAQKGQPPKVTGGVQ